MEALKKKLTGLQDNIEAAEEREREVKEQFRDLKIQLDAKLEEKESLRRTCQLATDELARTEEQYKITQTKLDEITEKKDADEEIRKVLEEVDRETEEKLVETEENADAAEKYAVEQEQKVAELSRKLVVVERDLQVVLERAEAGQKRVQELEARVEKGGVTLQELEGKDAAASEREEVTEEKISFIQEQLNQAIKRCEDADFLMQKRKQDKEQVECEIDQFMQKITDCKNEFDAIAALGLED